MQTILVDGSRYASSGELHSALRAMLRLPDYYGMNADALYDCLSERQEPVHLWVASRGTGEVETAVRRICHVIEDLGGDVRELNV